MKTEEQIIQEISYRYPETPQAVSEAAKLATEEMLTAFQEFIETHVQSLAWLPHQFWSITSPISGDEFFKRFVEVFKQ